MKKLVSVKLLVVAIAGVLLLAGPLAHAAPTGGGEVDGTVTLSPGLSDTRTYQTYTFQAIELAGMFVDGSTAAFGQIKVTDVHGHSNVEGDTVADGAGVVGAFTFSSGTALPPGSFVSGSCGDATHDAGTYTRTYSIVTVSLGCKVSINNGALQTMNVAVRAQFTPTSGNGVTNNVTAANFAGEFNF